MDFPVHKVIFVLVSGHKLELELANVKHFLIRPIHPSKRRDRLTLLDPQDNVIRTDPLEDFLANVPGIERQP